MACTGGSILLGVIGDAVRDLISYAGPVTSTLGELGFREVLAEQSHPAA